MHLEGPPGSPAPVIGLTMTAPNRPSPLSAATVSTTALPLITCTPVEPDVLVTTMLCSALLSTTAATSIPEAIRSSTSEYAESLVVATITRVPGVTA